MGENRVAECSRCGLDKLVLYRFAVADDMWIEADDAHLYEDIEWHQFCEDCFLGDAWLVDDEFWEIVHTSKTWLDRLRTGVAQWIRHASYTEIMVISLLLVNIFMSALVVMVLS